MAFKPPDPWWPKTCKPVSVVKLDETYLGLRFMCASGEPMTMPLGPVTFKMIWPK